MTRAPPTAPTTTATMRTTLFLDDAEVSASSTAGRSSWSGRGDKMVVSDSIVMLLMPGMLAKLWMSNEGDVPSEKTTSISSSTVGPASACRRASPWSSHCTPRRSTDMDAICTVSSRLAVLRRCSSSFPRCFCCNSAVPRHASSSEIPTSTLNLTTSSARTPYVAASSDVGVTCANDTKADDIEACFSESTTASIRLRLPSTFGRFELAAPSCPRS
mmetsp:Transcript_118334/g.176826  ORF Transcript_118334/g.176826 Transcript_118334/m.176826 type:complete len:216 (+) Transcript_118334:249-896(+)